MNDRNKAILIGTIIGDALGSSVDGLSKGHIHSIRDDSENYMDPAPLLKGAINKWKKAGLYSSLSQLMIITSFAWKKRIFDTDRFIELVKSSSEIGTGPHGIYRNPGISEKQFIESFRNQAQERSIPSYPTSRFMPLILPHVFKKNSLIEIILDTLSLISIFKTSLQTMGGTLLYGALIYGMIKYKTRLGENIIDTAVTATNEIISAINARPDSIFNAKINPDSLLMEMDRYRALLTNLHTVKDEDTAEKEICTRLNTILKTPITRATVDHPLAILPYVLVLSSLYLNDPSQFLFHVMREGGTTSVMTALAGSIMGIYYDLELFPGILVQNLLNRKRIFTIADHITRDSVTDALIQDFLHNEAAMTNKEIEEREARMKHNKEGQKKNKSRKERENELSKHIVESWTKIDRARWKKERKKFE
jgi:hypothetical protein